MLKKLKLSFKKRLFWVTLLGVSLIPALYNLSFLSSMWDPYGKLDQLPVAVVNLDQTSVFNNKEFTIGQDIVESLKETPNLDFHFLSESEAQEGFNKGDYYMVITLPKGLSSKAASLLTDKPEQLVITYETAKGRSFVASKMSDTAMTKLQDSVAQKITQSYTRSIYDSMTQLQQGLASASDGAGQLNKGSQELSNGTLSMQNGLGSFKLGLNSYTAGVDQISKGAGALNQNSPTMSQGLNQLQTGAHDLALGLGNFQIGLTAYTSGVEQVAQGSQKLTQQSPTVKSGADQLQSGALKLDSGLSSFYSGLTSYTKGVDKLALGIQTLANQSQTLTSSALQLQQSSPVISQLASASQQLTKGLDSLSQTSQLSASDVEKIQTLLDQLPRLQEGLNDLDATLTNQTPSQLPTIDSNSLSNQAQAIRNLVQDIQDQERARQTNQLAQLQATATYQALTPEQQAELTAAISSTPTSNTKLSQDVFNQIESLSKDLANLDLNLSELSQANRQWTSLQTKTHQLSASASQVLPGSVQALNQLSTGMNQTHSALDAQVLPASQKLSTGLAQMERQFVAGSAQLSSGVSAYVGAFNQINIAAQALTQNSQLLSNNSGQLQAGSQALSSGLAALNMGIQAYTSGVDKLAQGSQQLREKSPALDKGAGQLQSGSESLQQGLGHLGNGFTSYADGVNQVAQGSQTLNNNSSALTSGLSQLQEGSNKLTDGSLELSSGMSRLDEALKTASSSLSLVSVKEQNADAVADPTSLNHQDKDLVATNGVGLAPYMMSVALMIVALSANVVFSKDIDDKTYKNRWTWAKSKLAINGLIASLSSIFLYLTVRLVGVSYAYPISTFFVILLSSWTLMALVTALIGWNQRFGSFASLILLVLQLGSSAGTYPIELSPRFFQMIQPLLPMTYAVSALRQTISLRGDVGPQLMTLASFLFAFMALGLLIFQKNTD